MPSKESHIAAAKRNQITLDYLLNGGDEHLPWAVTVAFYKALHVVEAVFAADKQSPVPHADDHKLRNQALKTVKRYQHLWRMYRPLWEASLIARYLRVDGNAATYTDFSQYMSREDVEARVLGHYLAQLEASAARLLGEPELFT